MTEEIAIESLAYGGDGVGHLPDGRVVFVAGACPGDVCAVDYSDAGGSFVKGTLSQILTPGPGRVQSLCPEAAAGRCGGCPWSHVDYEHQLFWKRRSVVDALVRIGKIPVAQAEELVSQTRPSKKQWGYRNKIELVVGQDVAGRFSLGAHAHGGGFTPLSTCHLMDKRYVKMPKALTGALRYSLSDEAWNLGIERVGLRISLRTGSVEAALWTKPGRFPRAHVARVLSDALPSKRPGVVRVLVKGDAKRRKVAGIESLGGNGSWREIIHDRTMRLSAPSFFQVNTKGAETLIDLVMEGLQPDGLTSALDLYCGAGTFTLPLAEECMDVAAIEAEGSSVRDLRHNLEANQLYADVVGGDVGRMLPELGTVDIAVVDPPRAGLAPEAAQALLDTNAKAIAYVSCDPTTLARDLAKMTASGRYRIDSIVPVDLFPQTYHVETVTILSKVV